MPHRTPSAIVFPLAVVVSAALAVTAAAYIESASDKSLVAGTEFRIAGTGFARPAKAWLDFEGRRVPLKVLRGATAEQIDLRLARAPRGVSGSCVLAVRAQGQKVPFHLSGMSIELPKADEAVPDFGGAGTEFVLSGSDFGSRKGRVLFGKKPAKVRSWTDTEIRAVVPKGVPSGDLFLDVENSAGRSLTRPLFTAG